MNNLFIPPAHFIDRLKTEEVHIISLTAKLGQIYFQIQKIIIYNFLSNILLKNSQIYSI